VYNDEKLSLSEKKFLEE